MPSNGRITTTKIHVTALDGIINANSLLTVASFVGLSLNTSNTTALVDDQSCSASSATMAGLVSFHVYSFSSFLFSSLIAVAMKQAIKAHLVTGKNSNGNNTKDWNFSGIDSQLAHVNMLALRVGTLVGLIQIKLGIIGCGSWYNLAAIGPLVTLVPLALIINVLLVLYAFSC